MSASPRVSVIIPTHDRCASLLHTLDALCRQTLPPESVEVIVVADGCSDDTVAAVTAFGAPYRLVCIEQVASGPAEARNAGAACASAALLVFLDDDIEAWPGLLEAHLRASAETGGVVIGYLPTVLAAQQGYYRIELRNWWENMFIPMRVPGYRFRYSSLLTGNFAIPAEMFRRMGGFNTDLRCHEDYEFGYRLIRAGVEFVFNPQAGGYHHEMTLLPRTFARKFQEGRADVAMARLHPDLLPVLQLESLFDYGGRLTRWFFRSAFDWPGLGDTLAAWIRRALPILERVGLRGRWRRNLERLLVYWYLRGVASVLGNRKQWRAFLEQTRVDNQHTLVEITIDLAAGLEAAEKQLDEARPDIATFTYNGVLIGATRPAPGAEALRGRHLRRVLNEELGWELAGVVFPQLAAQDQSEHGRLMAALFARWRDVKP